MTFKAPCRLMGLAFVCAMLTVQASAQNSSFTYQGELRQGGNPANGSFNMVFSLWDSSAGGNQVGTNIVLNAVSVSNGRFTVDLDFGVMPYADNAPLWLQIRVGNSTLSPRQRLAAAPHSLSTRGIEVDADGNISGDQGIAVGNDAFLGMGGGQYPNFDRVHDFSHRVTDFSSTNLWSSVLSVATIDPQVDLIDAEIYGNSFELNTAATSDKDVTFVNGLFGAVFHRGTGTMANSAGGFIVSSVEGTGNITRNFGLSVNAGVGFSGQGSIAENHGIGIQAGHPGSGGNIGNNYSLFIQSPNDTRPINANYGIFIENQNVAESTNYSIYSEGGDVFFNGNLDVTGAISKGGGSFKIDHPLDPENKFLYHSFVESPEMMNIYNGIVTTGASGYATVELPDWFEALNRDFRYQLTVIDDANGDDFVLAKVVQRIVGNEFGIRTSHGNATVSWQVTGVRQDAWAETNRIPVEQHKSEKEAGRYLHPEAFGLDGESGIGTLVKEREATFLPERH